MMNEEDPTAGRTSSSGGPRAAAHHAAPSAPRRPRAVLFDAVGTLLRPTPSVAAAYAAAGRRHGRELSEDEIAPRFRRAAARQDAIDRRENGGRTDLAREVARWRGIVADVFDLPPAVSPGGADETRAGCASTDAALRSSTIERIFAELWDHFAAPANWRLFDDVPAAWRALAAAGLRLGIASNFDDRLDGLCRAIEPLNDCREVFVSSRIGWRKPRGEFFAAIAAALQLAPHLIMLVGDDLENDYRAATAAGWQAVLIDRSPQRAEPAASVAADSDVSKSAGSRRAAPSGAESNRGAARDEAGQLPATIRSLGELTALVLPA